MATIIYKNSRIYRKKPAFHFYDDPETTTNLHLFSYDNRNTGSKRQRGQAKDSILKKCAIFAAG